MYFVIIKEKQERSTNVSSSLKDRPSTFEGLLCFLVGTMGSGVHYLDAKHCSSS
jgi:hypothetical protein